ncbi:MAG: hypothetical protein HY901_18060 [Deltaproteobacteria bacterium]|nr:hypothetical protein [Deltaproteobacteria bacterium]
MFANFFEAGGFGMYPTSLFGFFLVAAAVIYALRPERGFFVLTGCLGLLTLSSGLLGFTTGLVNTFRYLEKVPNEKLLTIAALGCAESLNNVVLALILVTLTSLIVSVGALRAARSAPRAVAPADSAG